MVWRVTNEVDEGEWIVIWRSWCGGGGGGRKEVRTEVAGEEG